MASSPYKYACAIIQYDIARFPFDDAIRSIAKLGYQGIELHVPPPPDQKNWAPLKALLRSLNLETEAVVVPPADWAKSDEKMREGTTSAFRDAVLLAGELGTSRVMTETGPASPGLTRGEAVELAARGIATCADFAAAHGVDTVMLECVPPPMNYVVDNTEKLLEFMRIIGAKNVYGNVDASNFLMAGDDPATALRKLGPLVKGIHVKDGMRQGAHWTPIGEGQVDWKAFFAAAREIGYRGWLTSEYEGAVTRKYYTDPEKASRDTLAFTRNLAEQS